MDIVHAILAGDLNVDALEDAAVAAGLPASVVSIWLQALAPVAAMRPVFLHGDVCENQLIVDADRRVTAVLDWDTAGVGHPLHDFDFGEWGVGIFAWETHFADLRHRMWSAYCGGASAQPAPAAAQVHLAFTVSDLLHFAGRRAHGALDAWGERRWRNLVAEIGPATEAALEQE